MPKYGLKAKTESELALGLTSLIIDYILKAMLRRFLYTIIFLVFLPAVCLAEPQIEIGKPFPFQPVLTGLPVVQGQVVPAKTKIVMFFTSWSESCVKELAALSELHNNYKNKDFEIIAVSFDSEIKSLLDCIEKNNIEFTVLHDEGAVSTEEYKILVIPTTYIVKSDETIKNIFMDFDRNVFNSLLTSVLKEIGN